MIGFGEKIKYWKISFCKWIIFARNISIIIKKTVNRLQWKLCLRGAMPKSRGQSCLVTCIAYPCGWKIVTTLVAKQVRGTKFAWGLQCFSVTSTSTSSMEGYSKMYWVFIRSVLYKASTQNCPSLSDNFNKKLCGGRWKTAVNGSVVPPVVGVWTTPPSGHHPVRWPLIKWIRPPPLYYVLQSDRCATNLFKDWNLNANYNSMPKVVLSLVRSETLFQNMTLLLNYILKWNAKFFIWLKYKSIQKYNYMHTTYILGRLFFEDCKNSVAILWKFPRNSHVGTPDCYL